MDHKLLLAKCITLLAKESHRKESDANSRPLVEEAISKIKTREVGLGLGTDKDVVDSLKETVKDLLNTPHDQGIDKPGLVQRIRINVADNDKLFSAIEKGINEEQTEEERSRSISSIRHTIERHLKDVKVSEILTQASAAWNYNREKITDPNQFLTQVWTQLEPLSAMRTVKDSAIIDEVRLGDKEKLTQVLGNINISIKENRLYKTGWQGVNRMLQGGFRPAEFWVTAALQHKYKTGFMQTIINHIALYNKPMLNIPNKKSAIVVFAFEDTIDQRFEFIFKQLMFNDTREHVEITNFTKEQMQDFIFTKLSMNGFEMLIYRVDPHKWTFHDMFNRILQIEQDGFAIEFVGIDYLEKLPTTGCNQGGATGNDILELFGRVRTFFSAKGIPCITPHQLSTEAKKLIRGTVTEDKLVEALQGRGYYKGTSQLDQIPDGILLHHVFQHGDGHYLAIQRDRHRITSILEEKYKRMYLKFPKGMPIPDDLNSDDSTIYKLPPYRGNASDDLFSFGDS